MPPTADGQNKIITVRSFTPNELALFGSPLSTDSRVIIACKEQRTLFDEILPMFKDRAFLKTWLC